MHIIILLSVALIIFVIAYRYYSPYIAKILGVDPARKTPAHTMRDDIDYCPAKTPILFGHHFASIAGAAPIVGPVIAAAYGWGPVALWIIIGGVFLGGTHDFSALIASVRHDGHSIGNVIERFVGRTGKLLFLLFLWTTLILVIAVFSVVVVKTFISVPAAATASVLFICLAVIFGTMFYKFHLSLLPLSIIGVIFLAICIAVGWHFPLVLSATTWTWAIVAYIFVASVTPVWILLQPRDYLNSFLLYALLISGVTAIFVAKPHVELPIFIAWNVPKLGSLFPILFVTVACGAISGFHSVVASGTSSKQISNERAARPVGYGAMLVESLLAMLALIAVMHLSRAEYASNLATHGPITIFAQGLGVYLSKLGISAENGIKFAALAVSAFVLTSLDTATRLARFAFQEFFAPKEGNKPSVLNTNRYIGTTITVTIAAALALSGQWRSIWPIFGSANQLLAALTLLAVALWLKNRKRPTLPIIIPMYIMFTITLSALVSIVWNNFHSGNAILAGIAASLFILALILALNSIQSMRKAHKKAT